MSAIKLLDMSNNLLTITSPPHSNWYTKGTDLSGNIDTGNVTVTNPAKILLCQYVDSSGNTGSTKLNALT